jgi:hypothetical protein
MRPRIGTFFIPLRRPFVGSVGTSMGCPRAVICCLIAAASLVAFSSSSVPASAKPVLSAPNSIWNTPVGPEAPISLNSEAMVAGIANSASQGGTHANTTSYSDPIYVVPKSQPKVPVVLDASTASLKQVLGLGAPIPPEALPAPGTDSLLVIDQPSTDSVWDFWRASTPAENAPGAPPLPWGEESHGDSRWHIAWGGVMNDASHSPGYFDERSWLGMSTTWWGNSASSLLTAAGIPLISEMKAAHIDHVVGFLLPRSLICAPIDNAWPAQRDDGGSTAADCIPEGTRLRLDPSLDLSTLHLSPLAQMVAKTAQKYGMILHDGGSIAPTIQLEDPNQYPINPYTGPTGLFGGLPSSQVFANFPWSQMQVLNQSRRRYSGRSTTTTSAKAASNSISSGQSVRFSVRVARSDGSPALGAVYLEHEGTIKAMSILHNGTATLSSPLYTVGIHPLTVVYGGDEKAYSSAAEAISIFVS